MGLETVLKSPQVSRYSGDCTYLLLTCSSVFMKGELRRSRDQKTPEFNEFNPEFMKSSLPGKLVRIQGASCQET